MNPYPDTVQKIAADYMMRLAGRLDSLPRPEREDFMREMESHIFEAYQEAPGEDPVARMLGVLAKVGEPSEVVAGKLPESLVRSGTRRFSPPRILAGLAIALFGVPLGLGGAAVVLGAFAWMVGILAGFYGFALAITITGLMMFGMGLLRSYQPDVWDRLVQNGVIELDPPVGPFLDQFSPSDQGAMIMGAACLILAVGVVLLYLGRHVARGVWFLATMVFDGARRAARRVRGWWMGTGKSHMRAASQVCYSIPSDAR